MRVGSSSADGSLVAKAVSGTHGVCIGLDVAEGARDGLLGFSVLRTLSEQEEEKQEEVNPSEEGVWVRSHRYFPPVQLRSLAGNGRQRKSARVQAQEPEEDLHNVLSNLPEHLIQEFCFLDQDSSTN